MTRCVGQILFGMVAWLFVFAGPAWAQTTVPSAINSDVTWNAAGSPYIVPGFTSVTAGATVTVESGVSVQFDSGASLHVYGQLYANDATFTSNVAPKVAGSWGPLAAYSSGVISLTAGKVEFGGAGASPLNGAVSGYGAVTSINISGTEISNNLQTGVIGNASTVVNITGATISGNGQGVHTSNSSLKIIGSFIESNSGFGVRMWLDGNAPVPGPNIVQSNIASNDGAGISISTPPILTDQFPQGHHNNIYGNNGNVNNGQFSGSGNADALWTQNYWGEVDEWVNLAGCTGYPPTGLIYTGTTDMSGPISGIRVNSPASDLVCRNANVKVIPYADSKYDNSFLTESHSWSNSCGAGENADVFVDCVTDPVNTLTGGFQHSVTDISQVGLGHTLDFGRSYNSRDLPAAGPMGDGWRMSYTDRLEFFSNGDVTVVSAGGQRITYLLQSDGSYQPVDGTAASAVLSLAGGVYELQRTNRDVLTFAASGQLTSFVDGNGNGLAMAYTGGNLTALTDAQGRVTTLAYDASNRLELVTASDGRSVAYGYASGRLASVTDVRGKSWTIQYTSSPVLLKSITDPRLNKAFVNTYDSQGRVTAQLDAMGEQTLLAYDDVLHVATMTDQASKTWSSKYASGRLAQKVDPKGNTTNYIYDASNNVIAVEDARGKTWTMTHDARGNVLSRTGPSPRFLVESWTYNSANDVTSYTNGRNKQTLFEYDGSGNLTKVTRPGANVTEYTIQAGTGLVTAIKNPRNKTTALGYDGSFRLTSVTSPGGRETTFGYDAVGRVTSKVSPRGHEAGATATDFMTEYQYDPAGNVTLVRDPLDFETVHEYDDSGNLASTLNAELELWSFTYNAANERTHVTGPGNRVWETKYDARGQVSTQITPQGRKTTFTYEPNGLLDEKVMPRGNVAGASQAAHAYEYEYDGIGNLVSVTDPRDEVTAFRYEDNGWRDRVTDQRGFITDLAYDANGNLQTVTDAENGVTTYTYDDLDRATVVNDARGKDWRFGFDANDNLVSEKTPKMFETQYSYDDDDLLVAMIDPRGFATGNTPADYTWTYGYDGDGNMDLVEDPLENQTSFVFDRASRLASSTTPRSDTTTYGYDKVGRLTLSTAPGARETEYIYNAVGDMTKRIDANLHETLWGYDDDGLVTSYERANGATWSYAYDSNSNLKTITDANGNATAPTDDGITTYGYSARDELNSIDYSDTTPDVSYGYDAAGNRSSMSDGQGSVAYLYDDVSRLLSETRDGIASAYTWDGVGNVLTRTHGSQPAVSYLYDDDSRLASVTRSGLQTAYTYDDAANQSQVDFPGTNGYRQTKTYDRAGRLTNVVNAKNGTVLSRSTLALNAGGAPERVTTHDTVTAYAYDDLDRLTDSCEQTLSADPGAESTLSIATCRATTSNPFQEFAYDDVGNRTDLTTNAATTAYTFNLADELTSQTGPDAKSYTYDNNGQMTSAGPAAYTYDLAGNITSATAPLDDTTTPSGTRYRYTGEQLDETGQYHLRARQYNPTTGRFGATDPIEAPMGNSQVSSYSYVRNMPTTHVDPSGEVTQWVVGTLVVGVGVLATASYGALTNSNTSGSDVPDVYLSPGNRTCSRINSVCGYNYENLVDNISIAGNMCSSGIAKPRGQAAAANCSSTYYGSHNFSEQHSYYPRADFARAPNHLAGGGTGRLNISDSQFGKKFGKHANAFGLEASSAADRQLFRQYIRNAVVRPDEVRRGAWRGGGTGYLFYRSGSDIVITKGNGDFVTALANGSGNRWWGSAGAVL